MDPATLIAVVQALVGLATDIPEAVTAGEAVVSSLQTGTALTADQQASIDAFLDKAHAALQAAGTSTAP